MTPKITPNQWLAFETPARVDKSAQEDGHSSVSDNNTAYGAKGAKTSKSDEAVRYKPLTDRESQAWHHERLHHSKTARSKKGWRKVVAISA